MKIDTSSYYPKSPLDDNSEEHKAEERPFFPDSQPATVGDTTTAPANPANTSTEDAPPSPPGIGEMLVDAISTGLSWIFVPLLAPVYGMLLIFNLSVLSLAPFSSRLILTLEVAAFNLLVPALVILLLKRLHFVDDIGLNGRKERTLPYIIIIICMVATGVFMLVKNAPLWVGMFFIGGAVAGLINLLINFRWKISAHAAGIAGLPAIIVRIMHVDVCQPETAGWLMASIIIAGLLGSARLWLGKHTLMQVLAGYAVGFFCVFFMTMI